MQHVLGTWSLSSPMIQSYQLLASLGRVLYCSLIHPPTQTPIPSPAQVTATAFLPLVGPGCGCRKVQDQQCKVWGRAQDTSEDLHNIKLQLQNTLTGQMQDCGRNGKKAFSCVFNKKPHVFSLHVIQLDVRGREGHKFRLHGP